MKLVDLPKRSCRQCDGSGQELDAAAIGRKMRTLREKKANLSLREVARRMDVSAAYVSDLEHGRRDWRPELIAKYKQACSGS